MTVLAAATTLLLWASAFTAIRVAVEAFPPGPLALLRFLIASLALGAWVLLRPASRPRLRRRDLPGFALLGILGVTLYHWALNAGERSVTAGTASLLVNTSPILTALLAFALHGERLSRAGWFGVGLGFCGAATLSLGAPEGVRLVPGAGLVLLAALSQGVYFVLQKPYLERYRPFEVTAWAFWLETLLLVPFAPALVSAIPAAPARATLAALYLGVFPGAVAYVAWACNQRYLQLWCVAS